MRGAALLLAVVLAGCQAAAAPSQAQRRPTIVSLNPCSDAVLAEVAEPSQVLGLSHYSFNPASASMDVATARRFRSVGDSAEEVLALRPDVVVAGTYLAPATATALQRAGIRLVRLPIAHTVAQSREQVRTLARLSGNAAGGEALVARIDVALVKASPPPGTPFSALVWQSGGIVAGDDSLIADILARTGFRNATSARGLRQADYLPLERMLADPPEVILSAGDDLSGEDRLLSHPALSGLTGVRRERLAPSLLWCGGPTIIRAAGRLAEVRASFAPPPTPSSEEEGAFKAPIMPPLLFRGGGRGVVGSKGKS